MKLRIFQSEKGDCMLLTGDTGGAILVDGGMGRSYREFVAPTLAEHAHGKIDLVYVSHIDEDHIAGILDLMDDMVAWRVHDFQTDPANETGNPDHPRPKAERPPLVEAIWHNAFHELVDDNDGAIANMLAATARILAGSDVESIQIEAMARSEFATSVKQAIQLSRRIGAKQLNIPLNTQFDGRLAFVRETQPELLVGGMTIFVVGPFEDNLEKLRGEWNSWLEENQTALKAVQEKAKADESRLSANEIDRVIGPRLTQAKELGDRTNVTAPNLASLMLLVEEQGRTILLTGDGHMDEIIRGLEHHGRMDHGHTHVNVLKVQHHGSEHNADNSFWEAVTADQYVFCGNGEHENPDLDIIAGLINARLQDGTDAPFHLWFSSSSVSVDDSKPKGKAARAHMEQIEELVSRLANESGGRLSCTFNSAPSVEITV